MLTLLWKDEEEWWTVRDARGNYGLVPVKYLDKVSSRLLYCMVLLADFHCHYTFDKYQRDWKTGVGLIGRQVLG